MCRVGMALWCVLHFECFHLRAMTAVVIRGVVLGRRFLSLDYFVFVYKDVLRVGCFSKCCNV